MNHGWMLIPEGGSVTPGTDDVGERAVENTIVPEGGGTVTPGTSFVGDSAVDEGFSGVNGIDTPITLSVGLCAVVSVGGNDASDACEGVGDCVFAASLAPEGVGNV